MTPSDKNFLLIKSLEQRDERALKQLYDVYWKKMYLYALKVLNHQQLCEDILQDIFLKIRNDFSGEWLLVLEIYELLYKSNLSFEKELLKYLESLKENIQISNLISTGLKLIRK